MRGVASAGVGMDDDAQYFENWDDLEWSAASSSRFAVVVHFFYPCGWESIARHLVRLESFPHDIFVTVPDGRREEFERVRHLLPEAVPLFVPNRGKDCYPFVRTARVLAACGYTKVLKLQTKKITGDPHDAQWQLTALDQLVPEDPHLISRVLSLLDLGRAGLVGPERYYLPLHASITHVRDLLWIRLTEVYDSSTAEYILARQDEFGFFGGTMFWARLDAVQGHFGSGFNDFEPEWGQKDGTLAHALERLFSLFPQVDGRDVWQLTAQSVEPRPYHFTGTPVPFGE